MRYREDEVPGHLLGPSQSTPTDVQSRLRGEIFPVRALIFRISVEIIRKIESDQILSSP